MPGSSGNCAVTALSAGPIKAANGSDLVVDLVPTLERMPEDDDFKCALLGAEIARCPVPQAGVIGIEHQRLLIEEALGAIGYTLSGVTIYRCNRCHRGQDWRPLPNAPEAGSGGLIGLG